MALRILVADDSITIQKMVRLAFQSEGAEVEAVSDGAAAMEKIRAFHPDIVLVDVDLPGLNGYLICKQVRSLPDFKGIPILLLVGAFDPFDAAEAARVGSNDYLTKPINASDLVEMTHSLTDKAMTFHENRDNLNRSETSLGAIEENVWESFVGSGQILEIFDEDLLETAAAMRKKCQLASDGKTKETSAMRSVLITDAIIYQVVEQVVKNISPDLIREVAWEVVPEISEQLVRRVIEEQKK